MKKLFILLTLLLFTLLVVKTTSAKVKAPAMYWHCLQNTYCASKGANCGDGVLGHRVSLRTKATDLPTKETPTGVFVCVGTKEGNICTSGDGNYDTQMIGYNGLEKLKQVVGYQFQGLFTEKNKPISPKDIVTNKAGKLSVVQKQTREWNLISDVYAVATTINKNYKIVEPLEMQDYTPAGLPRKWLALNIVPPVAVQMGQGGEQQGTFTFEGALANCVAISWDPYGIVFDSSSLEPVAGVKIALTKKRDNGKFTIAIDDDIPSILNPVTTLKDGAFEFFVPDGTYRLEVSAPNFTFPNVPSKLHPNNTKIYSELYRGEDIIEKGGVQHRDIPIDSKTPYYSPVELMAYFPMLDKGTNSFLIQGRVTHPLTKIKVYGKKPTGNSFIRTRLLTTFTADNKGQFDIRYDMNKLDSTEMVGDIELIKQDYTNLKPENNIEEKVVTDKKNPMFSVEPIPNYLEGYAYDANGKPLANTVVGVYLNNSNKPAYEVDADKNGFYRISSEYLPAMAYGVRYTTPGVADVNVSTSKFISQNAKYLEIQKTNLFAYKNKNGKLFTVTEREKLLTAQAVNKEPENNQPISSIQKELIKEQSTKPNLLPVILVLMVLGVGGVGAIIYFMKK